MIAPSRALDVRSARDLEKSSSGVRHAAVFTQPLPLADIDIANKTDERPSSATSAYKAKAVIVLAWRTPDHHADQEHRRHQSVHEDREEINLLGPPASDYQRRRRPPERPQRAFVLRKASPLD